MTRAGFGVLIAVALATGCAHLYVEPLPSDAVPHRAKTSDGWELELVQYKPAGAPKGRPVLLGHGISANGRNLDLDAEHSLARWLQAQGREAWTFSMRGNGRSDRADLSKGRKPAFDLDTLWREDLTAAIAYVREKTGAPTIDYVGHSMGGMVLYAYLSQGGAGVNAAVTLGSPTRLDWGSPLYPTLDAVSRTVLSDDLVLPAELGAALTAPLAGEVPDELTQLVLYNPENVDKLTWKRMMATGVGDVSGALLRQLGRMLLEGGFVSADGKIDYRRDMAKIRVPILVVAGKLDRIGTVPAVKDGYRALGGPKEWILLGEEYGEQADYGHMELVIGERAPTEVFPRVLSVLDRHSAAAPGVSTSAAP
jgi:pimeloyl-ACP methyl ester carboxylesterase